ncbi:MAG TPA: carboxynorspermidine decarboxylase [Allosphingosinicella sp.]|jgi:carboxynorspermidine decarboxylase
MADDANGLPTRAGGPGRFADFDLRRVETPAFVVDEAAIRRNLSILSDIKHQSGARILLALKAFAMWALAPVVREFLDGVCASGLWEARLAREKFGGEVATFCAGYKAADIEEILKLSDHLIFNGPQQLRRYLDEIAAARDGGASFDIGLRINPQHSVGEVEKYDPSQRFSRLGYPISQLDADAMRGVEGLHFHNLCEQNFEPLRSTWEAVRGRLAPHFGQLKWLNFGGGHHITRSDYRRDALVEFIASVRAETGLSVYLEPGEAVALDAGILVGEILDTFGNEMPLAITDISATCHMPDVIEAPYRPALLGEAEQDAAVVRIGGPSCLAGDIIGDFRFASPPQTGDRIAFLDQAHYSMVKTNSFNGVPLPSIYLWNSDDDSLRLVRRFDYTDFRDRLS